MPATRLNVDILAIVSEFLTDVPDVRAFALIDPSFHRIAIRRLLSMRPVSLTGGDSIRNFHACLFADPSARTPHVRALDIENKPKLRLPPAQPGDSPLLIDILTSCPNLQQISVSFPGDPDRLTFDPRVVHAIASLPRLSSLHIYTERVDTFAVLREIRAPLRILTLYGDTDDASIWHPAALETFVSPLAPTLEKLELDHLVVDADEIRERMDTSIPSVFTMTPYSAVRSLHVSRFPGVPLLDHLQYLFPALDRTLSIRDTIPKVRGTEYTAIRTANQRAQESSRNPPWRKLDRLICDPRMMYMLGLRCPIRHAILHPFSINPIGPYALEALSENPVPRLTLTLQHRRPRYAFDGMISPELAGALTHLTLCVIWDFHDCNLSEAGADTDVDSAGPPGWRDILVRTLALPYNICTNWVLTRTHSCLPSGPSTTSLTSGLSSISALGTADWTGATTTWGHQWRARRHTCVPPADLRSTSRGRLPHSPLRCRACGISLLRPMGVS